MANIVLPIDPFQLTQEFGVNPAAYAQFGLKGHNGWDIRTSYTDTPAGRRYIYAPQDAIFSSQGNEGNGGYGLYFEVKTKTSKNTWKHTFAHCHSIESFTDKKQGETMAISDNTGNSTGPHLHWTVKRLNPDGSVKDYNNGYFGAVNPQEYIDEVRADGVSPTPTNPNIIRKASFFDRIWNAYKPGANSDLATEQEVNDYIAWVKSNVARAGKWDQECIKAYGQVDSSKVTVDELYAKIQSLTPQPNLDQVKKDAYNLAISDADKAVLKLKK